MLLTTREAGRRLHTSAVVVHKLVEAGLLRAERSNLGLVLIPEEALRSVPLSPQDIVDLVRQKQTTLKASEPKEHSNGSSRP